MFESVKRLSGRTLRGVGLLDVTPALMRAASARTCLGHAPPSFLAAVRALAPVAPAAVEALAPVPEPREIAPITSDLLDVHHEHLDPELALLHAPHGEVADAYKSMFYHLATAGDPRRIMITTSSADDDGSAVAANLALAIAACSNESVLLVEANFARPRLASLFGYTPRQCLGKRLGRDRRRRDEPWRVAHLVDTNLGLLALDPHQEVTPALDTPALHHVVRRFMKSGFGYVVINGPPAVCGSDAPYVAAGCDGVAMLVYAGHTRLRDLRRAMATLGAAPFLGCAVLEARSTSR